MKNERVRAEARGFYPPAHRDKSYRFEPHHRGIHFIYLFQSTRPGEAETRGWRYVAEQQ